MVPDFIKNQPWNIMKMPEGAAGDILHDAIHGKGPDAMDPLGRLWNGTPPWSKVLGADASGKAANLVTRRCGCD